MITFPRVNYKVQRIFLQLMYTHTHTHIYIYIYVCIYTHTNDVTVGSRPSLLQCKYEHVLPYFSVKL